MARGLGWHLPLADGPASRVPSPGRSEPCQAPCTAGPTPTGHSPNIWMVFQHLDGVPSAGGGRREAGRRSRLREQCGSHRLGCENLLGGSPARPWRAGGGDQAKAVPGQVGGDHFSGSAGPPTARRGQVTVGPSPGPNPQPQGGPHCLWGLQLSFYLPASASSPVKWGDPAGGASPAQSRATLHVAEPRSGAWTPPAAPSAFICISTARG